MRQVSIVTATCALGAIVGTFMIASNLSSHAEFVLGVLVLVVVAMIFCTHAVMKTVEKVNRPADQAFEDGFEMGRAKGYGEGRRIGGLSSVADIRDSDREATG